MMKKQKIVLVGPLPPPIGGATILFKMLAEEAGRCGNSQFSIVQSNPAVGRLRRAFDLFSILISRDVSLVMFHMSSSRGVRIFPLLHILGSAFGKKVGLHAFGGNFDVRYQRESGIVRMLFDRALVRAPIVLFETKWLVDFFRCRVPSAPISQLPNFRDIGQARPRQSGVDLAGPIQIVSVGRVCEEKGIRVLLEALQLLPERFVLTVYGPLDSGFSAEFRRALGRCGGRAKYGGVVRQEDVGEILAGADCFVFPSYWAGEGHPGVLLEAYSAGVPVVAANWRSVPEILPRGHKNVVAVGESVELANVVELLFEDASKVQALVADQYEILRHHDRARWGPEAIRMFRLASESN